LNSGTIATIATATTTTTATASTTCSINSHSSSSKKLITSEQSQQQSQQQTQQQQQQQSQVPQKEEDLEQHKHRVLIEPRRKLPWYVKYREKLTDEQIKKSFFIFTTLMCLVLLIIGIMFYLQHLRFWLPVLRKRGYFENYLFFHVILHFFFLKKKHI